MLDSQQQDRVYHFIMETFVKRGHGPHYTEIAREFAVSPEEGRRLLHGLMDDTKLPIWLYPKTDLIASFAPFHNFPTPYHITIDGQQKWFAQWGFEALAVCWVFPGKTVQVDAPCLDCGKSMHLVVRDGQIESHRPTEICGYVDIPIKQWAQDWPYTWSRIHLFRSEEHARNWSEFRAGTDEAILPLADIMALVSTPRHSARLWGKYVSSAAEYAPLFVKRLEEVTGNSSFWDPTPR